MGENEERGDYDHDHWKQLAFHFVRRTSEVALSLENLMNLRAIRKLTHFTSKFDLTQSFTL
jgi:hypothetical protein